MGLIKFVGRILWGILRLGYQLRLDRYLGMIVDVTCRAVYRYVWQLVEYISRFLLLALKPAAYLNYNNGQTLALGSRTRYAGHTDNGRCKARRLVTQTGMEAWYCRQHVRQSGEPLDDEGWLRQQ
ncbi:MAG: hypothetical protein Q9170_003152 [Blastenia crenularia]